MNLARLAESLGNICKETGEFILEQRYKVEVADIELKSLNSLVSYVDKEAEHQLVAELHKLIPDAGFITEEDTPDQKADRYNWIIDPLDGTTNFLHGIPVFAISVALMENDEVVLGTIYELGQKEMFTAWKGGGAYLNGKKIGVSSNPEMAQSLMATGFPYHDFERMAPFFNVLDDLFKKTRGVRRLGSAATDLAYVACGRFDGFFEYGLSPWDVAAGVILVKEAGGQLSDYSGGDSYIFGGEIIAASGEMYSPLLECIRKHMGSNNS